MRIELPYKEAVKEDGPFCRKYVHGEPREANTLNNLCRNLFAGLYGCKYFNGPIKSARIEFDNGQMDFFYKYMEQRGICKAIFSDTFPDIHGRKSSLLRPKYRSQHTIIGHRKSNDKLNPFYDLGEFELLEKILEYAGNPKRLTVRRKAK